MDRSFAPDIYRQRFLIEGYYDIEVTREKVDKYLRCIANHLNLKIYGDPIIFSPEGKGKEENQGFDAFIPLIDSGISTYIWSTQKFFSIILYTCKSFDESAAKNFTIEFFNANGEVKTHSF